MSSRRLGLLGVVVVVVTGLLADRDRWWGELGATQAANDLPDPAISALDVVMQLGTRPAIVLVAVVAVVTSNLDWRRVALGVVLAGAIAWGATTVAKEVVERPRPVAAEELTIRDDTEGWSWPSSHTAIATASLTAAAAFSRRRRAIALTVAVGAVVGFARMAMGVHLPLDVVGGLGVGLAAAGLGVLIADR